MYKRQIYPDVATDLKGNITWYYYPNDTTHSDVLTRPLPGGTFLTFQDLSLIHI